MKDFDKEEINKAYDLYDEISCNFVEQDDPFASLEQRDFWAMLIYMNGNIIDDELSDQLCSSFDEFNKKIKENQVFYNTYFPHYCFSTDHVREFAYKEAKRFFTYREIDKEIKRNKKIKRDEDDYLLTYLVIGLIVLPALFIFVEGLPSEFPSLGEEYRLIVGRVFIILSLLNALYAILHTIKLNKKKKDIEKLGESK